MPNAEEIVMSIIFKSFLSPIHIYMPVYLILRTLLASKVPDYKSFSVKVI